MQGRESRPSLPLDGVFKPSLYITSASFLGRTRKSIELTASLLKETFGKHSERGEV